MTDIVVNNVYENRIINYFLNSFYKQFVIKIAIRGT